MKNFKLAALVLTPLLFCSTVSAMSYDKARNLFNEDANQIMANSKLPKLLYKGATIERVKVDGTAIVYEVTAKDNTYFPDNINGYPSEDIATGLVQNLKETFCKRPYISQYPVMLVMRFENGANVVSDHDSVMVNTKDSCN